VETHKIQILRAPHHPEIAPWAAEEVVCPTLRTTVGRNLLLTQRPPNSLNSLTEKTLSRAMDLKVQAGTQLVRQTLCPLIHRVALTLKLLYLPTAPIRILPMALTILHPPTAKALSLTREIIRSNPVMGKLSREMQENQTLSRMKECPPP
jgi:hypothetical protein